MKRITDLLSPTYFVKNATLLWKTQGWCEKRNAFVKNAMLTWKTQPLCKKHNTYVKNATLKRTVQRDFWPPFFHHLNLPRPLIHTKQVKTFSNLVKISPSYSNFSEFSRGIIPWRVIWLFRILIKGSVQQNVQPVFFIIQGCLGHWVMGKNIFDFGYEFAQLFNFFLKSPCGIIPQRVILPRVSYPGESLMTRGVNFQFLNCLHRPLKG